VHLVSYSPLIPEEYKLLFIDVMEVAWVAILSTVVNSGDAGVGDSDSADGLKVGAAEVDERNILGVVRATKLEAWDGSMGGGVDDVDVRNKKDEADVDVVKTK